MRYMIHKYFFFPFGRLPFNFVDGFPFCAEVFSLMHSQPSIFGFGGFALSVNSPQIFITYCCVTNYSQFGRFKQTCIINQFLWSVILMKFRIPSFRISQKFAIKMSVQGLSHGCAQGDNWGKLYCQVHSHGSCLTSDPYWRLVEIVVFLHTGLSRWQLTI